MQDYGPDNQFAYMQGECYDKVVDKYTYRICPYGLASQLEGGRTTSLGSFEELVALDGSAQMSFSKVSSFDCCIKHSTGFAFIQNLISLLRLVLCEHTIFSR
jgi:hypothetical protein